jgi:hypothetical protein
VILVQLAFEFLEQSQGIGYRPGKPGQHLVIVKGADFAGSAFHNSLAESDLTVTGHSDFTVPDNGYNSSGMRSLRNEPPGVLWTTGVNIVPTNKNFTP